MEPKNGLLELNTELSPPFVDMVGEEYVVVLLEPELVGLWAVGQVFVAVAEQVV